jgi:polynucleotide 5'-hydroxyl-kinase GRC3/NOL9
MVDQAIAMGSEAVLVDTTGLVLGEVGRELKQRKIDLLSPDFILALQNGNELEPILEPYQENRSFKIYRLLPSDRVRPRSKEERRLYRKRKFERYFSGSRSKDLTLEGIGLDGKTAAANGSPLSLDRALHVQGLLVGLNDADEGTLGLGMLESFMEGNGVLKITTPIEKLDEVKTVHLGSLRLTPTYEEEWL